MRRYTRLGLAGLLAAIALLVAACGGAGGMGNMDEGQMEREGGSAKENMKGMDHSKMDGGSDGIASGMLMEDGKYSDERFIDAMVPHHEGAVEMAEVALENAEHQEVQNLAEEIIVAQEDEVEELKSIKQEEFGTSEVPTGMDMEQREDMGMMMDPQSLVDREPFDQAFIDAMIPHHRSAIEMAKVAYEESENEEIRALASDIVDAQRQEIQQMQDWRDEWYPEG